MQAGQELWSIDTIVYCIFESRVLGVWSESLTLVTLDHFSHFTLLSIHTLRATQNSSYKARIQNAAHGPLRPLLSDICP